MIVVHSQTQLSTLIQGRPWLARTLKSFGIDGHRSGHQSLRAACAAKNLNVEQVSTALSTAAQGPPQLQTLSLSQLCEYIVSRHHSYLRQSLPRLIRQLESLVPQQGRIYPALAELKNQLQGFLDEIYPHLFREEQVIFPAIGDLEGDRSNPELALLLEHWVPTLLADHEVALRYFTEIRRLTQNYAVPPRADEPYQALIRDLSELDEDMRWHMYAENELLFPRTLRLTRAA